MLIRRKIIFLLGILMSTVGGALAQNWKAQWISTMESQSTVNTWLLYRKTVDLAEIPAMVKANIAADSKYWLWINDKLVVFEGGLKRGPTPEDTYFDEVDIADHLKKGKNVVSILLCYFGKDGFSHKSSGRAGLLFDCQADGLTILSDKTWKCAIGQAWQVAGAPFPNFRLSESSLLYDARKDVGNWQAVNYDEKWMPSAAELGKAGVYPWNKLLKRPIPFWKDSGLKDYVNQSKLPAVSNGDTIICDLPYNAQVTPYLEIDAPEGLKVVMATDNYLLYGPETNIRAEYITRKGLQRYESLGWINGHKVYYILPPGIKIIALKYRESGYQTEFAGSFNSSDPFLNIIWEKARRTLYVNMRDTYMDCPERERAQWTGDAVNQMGQTFYAFSPSSNDLSRKWLRELINWQKPDGTIYAPVPAGNWVGELPCQSVTSIGYFGLWTYYLHSGDKAIINELYTPAKRYLDLWEEDGKGTMKFRKGDWTWGDWGDQLDTVLIYNLLYYSGVKGMHKIALETGRDADAVAYEKFMKTFKRSFNEQFWDGSAYRSLGYTGKTDDRVQALAVVTGVADKAQYPAILKVFREEEHASPYMEKYVLEAMFQMGDVEAALARNKKRFGPMVNNDKFSTLFEGWGIGTEGFGGGTVNHGWSGGTLTVLSQYLCGIAPIEAGYKTFAITPQPGGVKEASASILSVAGRISTSFINRENSFSMQAKVPQGTSAIISIPLKNYKNIRTNNKLAWSNGKFNKLKGIQSVEDGDQNYIKFKVVAGDWKFNAL